MHIQFTDASGTWCHEDCPMPDAECGRLAVAQNDETADIAEALTHALHSTQTAQGWYAWWPPLLCTHGAPECEEVGRVLAPHVKALMAQAWDAAIEHVWELSDPIETVERYDGLAMVNTVADMRQAKRENPYCSVVLPPAGGEG
jgi:hypothetical protein